MFRIEDIRGTDDHILAYKIIENKYIKNFLDRGQIYFGLLRIYREMESEDKSDIGDLYEAALTNQVIQYMDIDGKLIEIHGPNVGNTVRINANQCAFCFYIVGLNSFEKCAEDKYRFSIHHSILETICADKGGVENCSIIIFGHNTIQGIYKALQERNLPYAGSKVIYDDLNYQPKHDIGSTQYALECCFHKRKKYSYQNEFRIVALNTQDRVIDDLFVESAKQDFQVVMLKPGYDFQCDVDIHYEKVTDKIMGVSFNFTHSLKNGDGQ